MARTFMPTAEQRRIETAKTIVWVFRICTVAYAAISVGAVAVKGSTGLVHAAAVTPLWLLMVLPDSGRICAS